MSQSQTNTPGEQDVGSNQTYATITMDQQRQQAASEAKPPRLRQDPSTASSIERSPTVHLPELYQQRPEHVCSNVRPASLRQRDTDRTNITNRTNVIEEHDERAEKKQEQTVDVDNEYFALNPWYNQQKDKPVFGLAAPLPRTVRPGMWWGRSNLRNSLYRVNEEQDDNGVDRQDGLTFGKSKDFNDDSSNSQASLNHDHQHTSRMPQDPDRFRATLEGRNVSVQKLPTHEADEFSNHQGSSHESRDRAPVNDHGLSYSNRRGQPQHFGMQDGLPPLQELTTHKTSATQKEEKESRQRQHEAEQDYYNQYRNPIARLRAQYPQATAEFLAVCCSDLVLYIWTNSHRHSSTFSSVFASTYRLPHPNRRREASRPKLGDGALQS